MIFLLLKQKTLFYMKLIKLYIFIFIPLIVVLMMFPMFSTYIAEGIGFTINIMYVLIGMLLLGMLYVFMKNPAIPLDTPLIHYFYGTKYFKRLIYYKYLTLLIKSIIFGSLLYNIIPIFPFVVGKISFSIFHLCSLFFNIYFLSWINYNKNLNRFCVFVLYLISSVGLFIGSTYSLIVMFSINLIALFLALKINLDYEKFFNHCSFLYKATTSVASMDYESIAKMALAHSPEKDYKVRFSSFNPSGGKSIVVRNIIHAIRLNKFSLFLCLFAVAIGLILPENAIIIKLLAFLYGINGIITLSLSSIESFIKKIKSGFLLPFSLNDIFKFSLIVPMCLTLLYSLILGISLGILKGLVLLVLLEGIVLGCVFLIVRYPHANRLIKLTSSLLCLISIALTYFII